MNYSTAIFLVNDAVRAVAVAYDVDAEGKGIRPFTLFKTFDHTLEVGQKVLIPTGTRLGMTVGRVEELNKDVDLDGSAQLGWIIGTVDDTAYKAVLEQEEAGIARIKSAEAAARRRELAEKLLADNPSIRELSALTPDGSTALPAPATAE